MRSEKLTEIRKELKKILKSGEKFDISADDIIKAVQEKGVRK